ncbi:MAG: DNA recombination protein RmuC [Arcobacteraceae bacterium]|jgi:DNA recombination protein RmuC|nr:DNA recombination protein RmuC [Arcobacteraceae bacterium]
MIEILLYIVIGILLVVIYVQFRKNTIIEKTAQIQQSELQSKDIRLMQYFERLEHLSKIDGEFKTLQIQYIEDKALIAKLSTQIEEQSKASTQKIALLQENEERVKNEFKTLASEIFEQNSKKFTEQNNLNIGNLLTPMKVQLNEFKKRVEDVYDKESKDRSALQHELKILKELNLQISTDAINLTNALKGKNKQQGVWGEMILETVLENSGLRLGLEYQREVSLKDDDNKSFRPDVIVNLPDNRHIIIDAKTSLVAYNEYMSSEDELTKALQLKSHISSIKEHIKGLANKKYENLKEINSLDFIFMFIPIEGALLLALENDVNLYDEAFKQKIILVSPTTLLVALRAVENTWRYERQAQNIADVTQRVEQLYSKFYGFIEDLQKVGDGLKKADESYQNAFAKLSNGKGNLISQVTLLKKVSNIKPKKELENALVENALLEES